MSSLTIAAREATGETGTIAWSAELTDADGVPVAGHITSGANIGQIVQPSRGYTDADGDVTLDLEANANITPANTYWTVFVGPRSFLVSKGSGTQTLTAALASDPGTLGTTALAAHLADTSAAHAASAVSFSATGSISSTDVQAAVAEVATDAAAAAADVAAHLADTSAAHAASAVSFTPAGSVAATDVQAAVAEVDSEKLAKASNLSDVANAATAFGNIKQAATDSATGVVELATVTEANTGTDTSRAVTPEGVAPRVKVVELAVPLAAGEYLDGSIIVGTASVANGALMLTPVWVPFTFSLVGLRAHVTIAGSGSAPTVSLLVYNADATTGLPSTLFKYGGTINAASATAQEVTFGAVSMERGLYWVGGLVLGCNTGAPLLYCSTGSHVLGGVGSTVSSSSRTARTQTGLAAVPDPASTSATTFGPHVLLKAG